MVMDPRPYIAPGVQGWKKREMKARMKQINGQTPEEKRRIAEIRKRHREREEALARGETVSQPSEPKIAPEPESTPEVEETKPETSPEMDPRPDVKDMDRQELVEELEAAGKTAHPNSKDDTLRRKVRELRDEA